MTVRRGSRSILLFVALLTSVSACVTPTPPDGDPVPALALSVLEPEPVSTTLSVTATPSNFVPTSVKIQVANAIPPVTLTEAPFSTTFDVSHLASGDYHVLAVAKGGGYTVIELRKFAVRRGPNIVVVYVDDLDQTTTPYWDALPQTRALIADRGLTFTNAFTNNPACCPARALTLTGRYSHNNGVLANVPPFGGIQAFVGAAENDTVATRLQAQGYETAFLGKYLNGYEGSLSYVPPGWDTWFGLGPGFYNGFGYTASDNGTVVTYGPNETAYQTDVLAQRSTAFVESHLDTSPDRPFFLFAAPSAPHLPLPPAPRHQEHPWTAESLPQRPNFDEADVSDKPTWLRDGITPISPNLLTYLTNDHRNRMGSLLAIDDMVAGLVAAVDARGALDDTVFVFTSDNGYNLGAHRLPAKQAPYEESIRVPLALAGPGIPTGERDQMVGLVDLAPTLLELASEPVDDLDGRSLRPLFDEEPAPWVDDVLVEFRGSYPNFVYHTLAHVQAKIAALGAPVYAVPTYRALRTLDHLYVEWYGGSVHEYELYDLALDPYQLDNLVATPEGALEHADTVAPLHQRLDELTACAGAACRA